VEEQLSLFNIVPSAREDYNDVMKQLSKTCDNCRLGLLHPGNRGVIWRGNLEAKIAVISEAPGDTEMEKGLPLVGRSGQQFDKWASYMGLDTKIDTFITNVVQCQPDKVQDKKTKRWSQRSPAEDEMDACYPSRGLRIIRAMPNLEVVWCLGWVAAGCLLGGEPKAKSHENRWFKTSSLPGVAVFCMVHPSFIVREPNQANKEKVKDGLDKFKREYLVSRKVIDIVKYMEAQG
jgi:uracil-DNA glycosylase